MNKAVIGQPKRNLNQKKLSYFEPVRFIWFVMDHGLPFSHPNDHIQCQESVGLGDLTYTSHRLQLCLHQMLPYSTISTYANCVTSVPTY